MSFWHYSNKQKKLLKYAVSFAKKLQVSSKRSHERTSSLHVVVLIIVVLVVSLTHLIGHVRRLHARLIQGIRTTALFWGAWWRRTVRQFNMRKQSDADRHGQIQQRHTHSSLACWLDSRVQLVSSADHRFVHSCHNSISVTKSRR